MTLRALIQNPAGPHRQWVRAMIPNSARQRLIGDNVLFVITAPGVRDAGILGNDLGNETELWLRGNWPDGNMIVDVEGAGGVDTPLWNLLDNGSAPNWSGSPAVVNRENLAGLFPSLSIGGEIVARATVKGVHTAGCSKLRQQFELGIDPSSQRGWRFIGFMDVMRDSPVIVVKGIFVWSDPTDPRAFITFDEIPSISFPALQSVTGQVHFDERPNSPVLWFEKAWFRNDQGVLVEQPVFGLLDGNGLPFTALIDCSPLEVRSRRDIGILHAVLYEAPPERSKLLASDAVLSGHVPGGARFIEPVPPYPLDAWFFGSKGFVENRFDYNAAPSWGQQPFYPTGPGDRPVMEYPGSELFAILPGQTRNWRAARYGTLVELCHPVWRHEADGRLVTAERHPDWRTYGQVTWGWGSDFLGKDAWGIPSSPLLPWTGHPDSHKVWHHAAIYLKATGDELVRRWMLQAVELEFARVIGPWAGGREEGRFFGGLTKLAACLPELDAKILAFGQQRMALMEAQFLNLWSLRGVDPNGQAKPTMVGTGYKAYLPLWEDDPEHPRPSYAPWGVGLCASGPYLFARRWGWDAISPTFKQHMIDMVRTVLHDGFAPDPMLPGAWVGGYCVAYQPGGAWVVPEDGGPADPNRFYYEYDGPRDVGMIGVVIFRDMVRAGLITPTAYEQQKMDALFAYYDQFQDSTTIRRIHSIATAMPL